MTKEELKQKAEVCMHNALYWLKLPISKENVEQGGSYILKLLEPREKRIAELEKENAELKSELTKKADTNHSLVKQMADMESKNAELKAFRQDCVKLTEDNVVMARQRAEMARQLTKAKEIIKGLLELGSIGDGDYTYVAQAEQFLSEVEK